MGRPSFAQLTRTAAAAILLSVTVLNWTWLLPLSPRTYFHPLTAEPLYAGSSDCPIPEFAQGVVVSVKTGATVAAERVPVQAATSLRCAPNVVTFSDLEQDLGAIHIYDALGAVSPAVQDGNPDFDMYREQQELWQKGHNVSSLAGKKHPTDDGELAAWTLDKYKNVHVVEKTWAQFPDKDWYIFVDADTYIVWSTLLQWLATLDPARKTYIGSEVFLDGVRFAHGGSGYILSRTSMHDYAVEHQGTAALWETKIRDKCCGDLVVGMALQEQGTKLQEVWPLITGETQWTMPFGPHYWCHPQFTLHHMEPADMESLDRWEQARPDRSRPVTPKELFESLIFSSIPSPRDDWDNMAWDKGEFGDTGGLEHAASSFEECAAACAQDASCLQYLYDGATCFVGLTARHGKAKTPSDDKSWRSGWNETRIMEWVARQDPCSEVEFPTQQRDE